MCTLLSIDCYSELITLISCDPCLCSNLDITKEIPVSLIAKNNVVVNHV